MSSFITIKSIGLTNLNNAEFLAFMKGALSLLPTASEEEEERPGGLSLLSTTAETGVPALGLTAEFVSAMQADVEALAEVVSESRIAQETEESEVQDKRRDMTATYVTQLITNASKSPIAAESEAGNALYKVIKPYVDGAGGGKQCLPRDNEPTPSGTRGEPEGKRGDDSDATGRKV